MKRLLFFLAPLMPCFLTAQNEERTVELAAVELEGGSVRLTPKIPPIQPSLNQQNRAYCSFFWEFGDGNFKSAARTADSLHNYNEVHYYSEAGDYEIILQVTYHYDDGQLPKRKKYFFRISTGNGRPGLISSTFNKPNEAVAMEESRQPRPEEEMALALSYRNGSRYFSKGNLHLFFNEEKFPAAHFTLEETRAHFGERQPEAATLAIRPFSEHNFDSAGLFLENARTQYRTERVWQFPDLKSGETRNLFFTLRGLPSMIRDTSATIHLTAVFDPLDPAIQAAQFILPLEIVSSHDPNSISVSDNRLNFRRLLRAGNLAYKVNFQNLGDGPARKIRIKVETPAALNIDTLALLDWYPVCPVCPDDNYKLGCLDTAITPSGLEFTFRNVYLPGLRERGNPEPDSTKGFIRYRLNLKKSIPKLDITSRAHIYFDNNEPISTNMARSRFKAGKSPGLKAGYEFIPGQAYDNYPFAGISISPFRSWKLYPQAELLFGLRGKTEQPKMVDTIIHEKPGEVPDIDDSTVIVDTISKMRKFIAVELPVLWRYNVSNFFGAGLGASAQVLFEKGDFLQIRNYTDYLHNPDGTIEIIKYLPDTISGTFNKRRFNVRVFADLTFGSVRSGPNLGVRVGIPLKKRPKLFIQASLEWKF